MGGEHTIQFTNDVLWNCAHETNLLTNVTPINSIKNKVKKKEAAGARLQPILIV